MDRKKDEYIPPIMRLCAVCAGKMNANRPGMLTLLGAEETVECSWCRGIGIGGRWELWPPPRKRYVRRSGGGERARSGRV